MSDKPKKPTKPALYRNKDIKTGQLPKGHLADIPSAKPLPYTTSNSSEKSKALSQSASIAGGPKANGSSKEAGLQSNNRTQEGAGKIAGFSAERAKSIPDATLSPRIKNPIDKTDSGAIESKSLEARLKDLGDLAKLTPSMARTRPSDGKGAVGLRGEGKPEYDTKLQKPHSLSMRYRIPTKLAALFDENPEKLKKLSNFIMEQIRLSDNERSVFIDRLTRYRQAWKDFVSAGLDPAFEGAHDVHVPMTYAHIKAMSARIYGAIMDISPRFSLKPRTAVPEIQKEDKEELLNWIVNDYANMQQGWESVIDEDIQNFTGDGKAVTKQSWLRDIRKFTDVEETVRRPLQLDEDGYPIVDEKEIEKEEVLWDCPIIETVKLEDFWIIGRNLWDIDKADLIDHMQDYTKSDMIKSARLGFFHERSVDEVIKYDPTSPSSSRGGLLNNELKQLDDFITGVNKLGSKAGINTYKVHECYLRYDIDDDGIDEELVVWVEENSRKVLRISYLERVGPGGKRPFTMKLFTPDGKGLGELLYGLNNEIDYIHNMRLDYGTLQNLPFFFYRAASGLNPVQLKVGPGMGIPVDDPQGDVMFPRLNGGTAYGFQEEAAVRSYSENVSGITAFALAQMNQQGATRTATGTAALVNELNANIDIHIKRYQRGFKRNLNILDLQCQDLLPLGTIIRVLGPDGQDVYKRFEDRNALRFACDYELTANSINSNKAIERETAQMMLQQLANPIALQTGIATQANLYNAYKNFLQKYEVHDVDAYITKPEDAPDSPYSARDELSMIWAGCRPPLVIKDRHAEKLAFFNEFEQSDDFSVMTDGHLPLYREVKQYHQQMADAIAAQAANPVLQQGMNSLGLSAQLAARGGQASKGPAQQQSDLAQPGGQSNNDL